LSEYEVAVALLSLRASLVRCAAAGWFVSTALAREVSSDIRNRHKRRVEAIPDQPVQLSYHASAHAANCTPAALPTVRVTQHPKWGILSVRQVMLTTEKVAGCPTIKTPAQSRLLPGPFRLHRTRPRQLRSDQRKVRSPLRRGCHCQGGACASQPGGASGTGPL
jgi:hypothetical protein